MLGLNLGSLALGRASYVLCAAEDLIDLQVDYELRNEVEGGVTEISRFLACD